jgi:DNA sulfur modification protein DndE
MTIEQIRLSEKAKDQLIKLKRHTGVRNWNVLCRWAFCVSLAEPSRPAESTIPADSNVEMTWKVFAGKYEEIYMELLMQRCREDGVESNPDSVGRHFRVHLHRGIGYLSADRNIRSIAALVRRSTTQLG